MTIYEIAKEAKTSPSSVSRYLNNVKIKEETKKRIEAVLKKYNFKPNPLARGLVSKSMRTIGIITIDIRNNHYANTAYTFEQEFRKRGYRIIIFNIADHFERSAEYIRNLLSYNVAGIALIGSIFNQFNEDNEIMNMLKRIPVVCANGQLNLPNAYSLLSDDKYGCELSVKYLYEKGRRNIYLVVDSYTDSALNKIAGFKEALSRYGIYSDKNIIRVFSGIDGGTAAVKTLKKMACEFDAIICIEDVLAVGVINSLKALGYSVGVDVDVIGFNNTLYSSMTQPSLTTVDTKPKLQAELLSEMLDNCIKNSKSVETITIKPELVLRKSA